MKTSQAQYEATARYNKKHTRLLPIRLNCNTDADILARLESVPSKAGYIKELIRKDMQGK